MEYPVKLISIEGAGFFSGGHILAFYPNGTYVETKTHELSGDGLMRLSLNDDMLKPSDKARVVTFPSTNRVAMFESSGRAMVFGPKFEKIIVFCAALGYKAKVVDDFMPGETTEIKMQPLMNGGSIIFPNGVGHIPDFVARLNPVLDGQNRTYLHADNVSMNGGPAHAAPFTVGQPFTLEDNKGNVIRLTVKGMNSKSSILEYQKLPPGSPRPDPSPRSAFASSSENVASDDWKPLPIDRGNPLHEEAVEALETATEAIRENNEYATHRTEERDKVLSDLEDGLADLKTEDVISSNKLRKILEALKTAGENFSKTTIEGGKISWALLGIMELAKAIWPWLPWLSIFAG